MRVFVTGASGFIGSAIVKDLIAAGHTVLGLARSAASAAVVTAAGAEVLHGSLEDLDSLTEGAKSCDGVIHTAFIHDFSNFGASIQADRTAIATIGVALEGTNKPFITTSGLLGLAPGRESTEEDAGDITSPSAMRLPAELMTLELAAKGVRAMSMRLPPSVHGDGDHGFVPTLINVAREKGVSGYVGDGSNHWPAVHRLDAATLYRLALEKGAPGSRFHAIDDAGIPCRDIAEMIGQRLNIPVVSKSKEEAGAHFGFLGHFFSIDCISSSKITREQLGWKPTHAGLIEDLEKGTYF